MFAVGYSSVSFALTRLCALYGTFFWQFEQICNEHLYGCSATQLSVNILEIFNPVCCFIQSKFRVCIGCCNILHLCALILESENAWVEERSNSHLELLRKLCKHRGFLQRLGHLLFWLYSVWIFVSRFCWFYCFLVAQSINQSINQSATQDFPRQRILDVDCL
jgi:hypothetical protein